MSQMPVPIVDGRLPGPEDYWAAAELSPRRVRVVFGGETLADSRRVVLFRESQKLPVYYFPRDDTRTDALAPSARKDVDPRKGPVSFWDVSVGDKHATAAAFTCPAGVPQWDEMGEYVAFDWPQMDAWYEENEEIFVHPRDPYKRVDVLMSDRKVRIVLGGQTVAESAQPRLLFETGLPTRYYLPPEDVRMEVLQSTETHSRCPYKGIASYWSANIGEKVFPDVVWSYPSPIAECPKIQGLLCFFNERVDAIYVDGELQPRPRTKWSVD